ncbi:hypothetical protein Cadr_000015930 [Camelus dromedarius]|uniref:Uncharacterized protein n=1 Tax=Camelus dromedarius TaxID=9838 RepID=A0A5N4E8K6_CAMDR|nr:hypothetical protein Cadr_000015930 [Camelus dromedarius]
MPDVHVAGKTDGRDKEEGGMRRGEQGEEGRGDEVGRRRRAEPEGMRGRRRERGGVREREEGKGAGAPGVAGLVWSGGIRLITKDLPWPEIPRACTLSPESLSKDQILIQQHLSAHLLGPLVCLVLPYHFHAVLDTAPCQRWLPDLGQRVVDGDKTSCQNDQLWGATLTRRRDSRGSRADTVCGHAVPRD